MSQAELANSLGVTFQQVKQYEKGITRVSASRLARIAEVLKVPVSRLSDARTGSSADHVKTPASPSLGKVKAPSISAVEMSDGDLPKAPAFRAAPKALGSLTRRGYSEEEIYSLVVPKRTLARRQAQNELLTVEETDKALRLSRIAALAEKVFGDPEKARRWMRKPKLILDGDAPLVYLASEAGARVVEEMLNRIDSGILA
jgi:putative toxin-antitoxin system antitoxin component (TIGR02293 family)